MGPYPITAMREAIVNAFAHRDLSGWWQRTPVQVAMFSDRLVVCNPGGLYGPVPVESLNHTRDVVCENPEFEDKIATFRLTLFNTPVQREHGDSIAVRKCYRLVSK